MTYQRCKFCGDSCSYNKYEHKVEWVVPHGKRGKQYFHLSCLRKWMNGEKIGVKMYDSQDNQRESD